MQAMDIEKYLAHLGQELTNLGMQEPVRVLMIKKSAFTGGEKISM